jgi:hypothetical protein
MSDKNPFLNQLVLELYFRAGQIPSLIDIPIRVIDSPQIANEILKNSEIFRKNYPFLEKLSHGRFSTNSPEWEIRAKLTQNFYHQSTHLIEDKQLHEIYERYLSRCFGIEKISLKRALLLSAIEVISRSYGFRESVPWDLDLAEEISGILRSEQSDAWLVPIANEGSLSKPNARLKEAHEIIRKSWLDSLELNTFLEKLSSKAGEIPEFDAAGELIQNLFAASETTTSSMMWAVDILGRNPSYQHLLRGVEGDALADLFIDELLRLYPPIPFVTREVFCDYELEHIQFKKSETILISIIGINCHRNYWKDALSFQFPRQEFADNSYKTIAYKPFLSGPRVCGGMKLARRELKSALRAILKLFDIGLIEAPLQIEYSLTSRPSTHLDQFLERRST